MAEMIKKFFLVVPLISGIILLYAKGFISRSLDDGEVTIRPLLNKK